MLRSTADEGRGCRWRGEARGQLARWPRILDADGSYRIKGPGMEMRKEESTVVGQCQWGETVVVVGWIRS